MRLPPDRWLIYGTALGLLGLIAVVCFLKPGTTPWLPPCQFYKLTGLYCPGCGSTRMLYFLVHGHPWLAFRQNALAMTVLPGVIYGLALQLIKPASAVYSRISPRWMTAFCLVVLLFAVARNLPFEPFCRLAPGGESWEMDKLLHITEIFENRGETYDPSRRWLRFYEDPNPPGPTSPRPPKMRSKSGASFSLRPGLQAR